MRRWGIHLWLPFVLAVFAYLPTLQYGFVWDDMNVIVDNAASHRLSDLGQAVRHGYSWDATERTDLNASDYYYRPVVTAANVIGWAFSGGRPGFFHFQNMLAHAGATLLLSLLATWLGLSTAAALLVGCIFAVHPVSSEGVAWISGRTDVFAALFVIAALTLALGWLSGRLSRSRGTLVALGAAVFLAFGSKESAAVLVVLVPILLLLWRPPESTDQRDTPGWRRRGAWVALFAPVALYLLLRLFVVGGRMPEANLAAIGKLDFLSRLLLSGRLVLVYLQKLVLPLGLAAEPPASLVLHPTALLPGLGGLLLLASGVLLWIRRLRAWAVSASHPPGFPAGVLGLGLFLLALIPVLQWIQLGEIYGERFLYLPSAGLLLLCGSLLDPWLRRKRARAWVLSGAVGLPLLVLLQMHLPVWKDEISLFGSTVRERPDDARALANLGNAQMKVGRMEEAVANLGRSAQLDPADPTKQAQYGSLLLKLGRMEEGMRQLEAAYDRGARSRIVLKNLGIGWTLNGRYDDAAPVLREAMQLEPRDASLYDALATGERKRGRPADAVQLLRRALELDPGRKSAWLNLIGALGEAGQQAEAEEVGREFRQRFPGEAGVID